MKRIYEEKGKEEEDHTFVAYRSVKYEERKRRERGGRDRATELFRASNDRDACSTCSTF